MSFMMQIDAARAAQRSPLEVLAVDYFAFRPRSPSIEFCRRLVGVPNSDGAVARRLRVATSVVRGWREVGRRAESKWACR